jgi:DNA methylase
MSHETVTIGSCVIVHGDCEQLLGDMAAALMAPFAIVTDPPYGVGFVHSGNDGGRSFSKGRSYGTKFAGRKIDGDHQPFDPAHILALDAPTILWGANHYADRLPAEPGWLVWDKRAASHHVNDMADCEMAWTNLGTVARMFRHHWDGMTRASEKGVPRVHPMQKPIVLMEWCVGLVAHAAIVIDPYMGSGTTLLAAMRAGRAAIGIEKDREYFDAARARLEAAPRQGDFFQPAALPPFLFGAAP